MQLARQHIASRPIEVRFEPTSIPPVAHDPLQVQRLILNLLLNAFQAIKDKDGLVTVDLQSVDGFAQVKVRDNGIGIAPDHLRNIFRPFFTTKRQGTGLGLSLSRRIVEQHGGTIDVHSSPGNGTEFVVRLPLAAAVLETAGVTQHGKDQSPDR